MRAVVMERFGGPDVLQLREVPTPRPGPGEILVRVHAVSVNRSLDISARQGTYDRRTEATGRPGVDPSGVVVAHGPGVRESAIGARVTGILHGHACGTCPQCDRDRADRCEHVERTDRAVHHWRGYADYVVGRAANAIMIPGGGDGTLD